MCFFGPNAGQCPTRSRDGSLQPNYVGKGAAQQSNPFTPNPTNSTITRHYSIYCDGERIRSPSRLILSLQVTVLAPQPEFFTEL
jgi:hypothetical protein